MENLENIKKAIDYVEKNELEKEQVKSLLGPSTKFTSDQKNFIWNYLFPEPILDYELPSIVQSYFKTTGITGTQKPDEGVLFILIRALRSLQYGRFMKHLLYSFLDVSLIYPVIDDKVKEKTCPICGKTLYEENTWKKLNDPGKDYLAYSSERSDLWLCRDCLVQLQYLDYTMEIICPGYLESK